MRYKYKAFKEILWKVFRISRSENKSLNSPDRIMNLFQNSILYKRFHGIRNKTFFFYRLTSAPTDEHSQDLILNLDPVRRLKPQNPGVAGNMVYPVSTGDGWARISTIKMLSYPSGQGKAWGRIRRGMKRIARTGGWCSDLKVTGKWNARGCIVSHVVYLWEWQ